MTLNFASVLEKELKIPESYTTLFSKWKKTVGDACGVVTALPCLLFTTAITGIKLTT
jgi:hypothetical protein